MNKIKSMVTTVKTMLSDVKVYYISLNTWQKIVFVLAVIVCKIGPDFIMFPLLMKFIKKQLAKKTTED